MAKQIKDSESNAIGEDPDDIVRIVARRLQEARTRAGLTQVQLGDRAGVKQSYIFELEYGTTNMSLRTLEKMAKALDLDVRDLLPGSALSPPTDLDLEKILIRLDHLVSVAEAQLQGFVEFRSTVRAFGDIMKVNRESKQDKT